MESSDSSNKPMAASTKWHHENGRQSPKQKAVNQQYLTTEEEEALLVGASQIAAGSRIKPKQLRDLAFEIISRRPQTDRERAIAEQVKPLKRSWSDSFTKRHKKALKAERAVDLGWQRETISFDKLIAFTAQPSDAKQLCSECVKININLEDLVARHPYESRKVHTFQNLPIDINKSSCKLCRFILSCIANWNWPIAKKYLLRVHHLDHVLGPTLAEEKALLNLSIKDDRITERYSGWIFPTPLDAMRNVAKPTWGLARKTVDFEIIKEWLQFCDSNHSDGCEMVSCEVVPHFRLIDCTTRSIVKIVETCGQINYAALSYCWGPPPHPPHDDPKKLPDIAPLVIEDALEAARRLGIPYLWVDRYCIAQLDPDIKPTQLQNMDKVYRSAYVTIVAGCGKCPNFGLPGISTKARKLQSVVDSHGFRLVCMPDVVEEIRGCTWSTRGWTFQENVLSKRRLVFTETQTYFQCQNMHCCEAVPISLRKAHTKNLKRFKETIQVYRAFPQQGIGKTGMEIEARIQEYLSRDLTKDSDALNAFLGIFQAFQELDFPVYHFWGLPMSRFGRMKNSAKRLSNSDEVEELRMSFLSSLAWSCGPCDHSNVQLPSQRHGFPTWSWAAWKGLRRFSRNSITKDLCSPTVSFRSRQGQSVQLKKYEEALGSRNSLLFYEPYIYLTGWVTNVRFMEDHSHEEVVAGFKVRSPIPSHRVTLIMDIQQSATLRQQLLTESFQVLVIGNSPFCEGGTDTVSVGWTNVHAIILQSRGGKEHVRLGVVTWSRLGCQLFDEKQEIMRVKELFEARRVVPPCKCGCQSPNASPFDRYLEDDNHVMEFRKTRICLA